MGTAQVPPTPENVAETFTAGDNDFLDGDGWKLSLTAKENVVSIGVTPYDEDGNPVDEVHFRAVVVEGEETPVLLAGPAYVNGDDGYPALCCTACDDHIAYVTAGDDLAGLNAKVASHTCPAALSVSSGEADSRG